MNPQDLLRFRLALTLERKKQVDFAREIGVTAGMLTNCIREPAQSLRVVTEMDRYTARVLREHGLSNVSSLKKAA